MDIVDHVREILFGKRLNGQNIGKHLVVEVGANDSERGSKSRRFIDDESCSAVLIEPHPGLAQKLRDAYFGNDNVQVFDYAVSDSNGETILYESPVGESNGTHTTFPLKEVYGIDSVEIKVKTKTLTDILDEALYQFPQWPHEPSCPRAFCYLSVDTEAMDLEVFRGLDFNKYRPAVITTEEVSCIAHLEKLVEQGETEKNFISDESRNREKAELLMANGYAYLGRFNEDTLYISNNFGCFGSSPE